LRRQLRGGSFMQTPDWYLNRLRTMSPAEVAHRIRRALQDRFLRLSSAGSSPPPPNAICTHARIFMRRSRRASANGTRRSRRGRVVAVLASSACDIQYRFSGMRRATMRLR